MRILDRIACQCGAVHPVGRATGERIDIACSCGRRMRGLITYRDGLLDLQDIPLIDWKIANLGAG